MQLSISQLPSNCVYRALSVSFHTQKRENSRSVPRALSAGPERVKSKMEEELCEIDPAFFAFSVPGESRREYLDKLERVQKKLHGMFNSSPPRVKTFASRKPRTAMPNSANRLDLIRDQLFERARAGGSRLLSGTRIEGSRMLKTQWSKARVEERLSQYRFDLHVLALLDPFESAKAQVLNLN